MVDLDNGLAVHNQSILCDGENVSTVLGNGLMCSHRNPPRQEWSAAVIDILIQTPLRGTLG